MEIVEIDKELEELETKIDQLRGLYEQYFMGLEKLEPQIPRKDVEKRIKLLRKEQIRNTAQRFKFNTLAQRLNTLSQHWGRVVREIENGTYKRDVLRAAARFGEGALVGLGKKKAKQLAAAAALQGKRPAEDAMELGSDDLIEDEEDDDVPTPPKLEHKVPPAGYGLGPGDLPVVGVSAPAKSPAAAGLRWGAPAASSASDPASSIRSAVVEVKRPAAEPVAARRPASVPGASGGFGELDLDFEDAPLGRPPGDGGVKAPTVTAAGRALPAATPPPAQATARNARTATPQAGGSSGFGVLDIPLGDYESAPAPIPAAGTSSPGSGVRPGASAAARPAVRPGAPVAATPVPAAAARPGPAATAPSATAAPRQAAPATAPAVAPASAQAGGDLGDQRIRQIYAKYVEAKRSTQESTAGVTFEKLATSLRAQAEKLKSAHPSKSIDYEVVVKDGKTHLKPVLR